MEASLVACESFSALPRSDDASISSRTSPLQIHVEVAMESRICPWPGISER
ncbi:MAG: hypothetical protein ACJZ5D_05245 [Candidatus Thalassarchaeaceae archaeon]